ncbi:bifunctional pantoate--beta-alanine ligase/(d)CMP kinase [Synechococcus sp. GFB01]|uniref:bifunctional pantoate--beta-alanine ligase/(d)CMP kinase n=1 Tax=Synechococcus sp. GFB01 TaxID=1662190 RepID=UPI00064FF87A|nr:bifunctional pantoate--beta-alanine ligase/(d)CMP kinase [Synechococcus sp. GFB01]KMM17687.1 cytidylate kinase [Synechococcus sp. GFB01]
MECLQSLAALRAWRCRQSRPVHFVPTMGALHDGHAQLIRRAARPLADAEPLVVVSVYVNPLQFGPAEDFERYPRSLEADQAVAAAAGAALFWAPSVAEMQPGGSEEITRLSPPASLQAVLCGRSRPGHFDGVATVVARLLALVRPQRLFLGEKDWQQLVILRRLVNDLGLPLVVESVATVREADGLACSSRNRYLTAAERRQALSLPQALAEARRRWLLEPRRPVHELVSGVQGQLQGAGLVVDYVELVWAHSLVPLPPAEPLPAGLILLAAAVHCGATRLIDHTLLMSRSPIVAIDGPAGAGKSTVTRAFARRLGLIYLDTGAMYRAVTWWVQRHGVAPDDPDAVGSLLADLDLQLSAGRDGEQLVRINGHDVTTAIRSPEVTAQVSLVAALGCVREALTAQQQAMGRRGGLVAEGRDIGTAVFPDAELKVFLTATTAERARRRALDLEQRGFAVPPLSELEHQIAERDRLDSSREVAPLRMAADAEELVTDGMTIASVIQALVDLFRQRVPEEVWPSP